MFPSFNRRKKALPAWAKAALSAGAFAGMAATGRADNPFITSIYTADPSAHVWADGRLYVYPSRDIDPPRGCDLMDYYHVFSTADLMHWRDEGEILNASEVDWGRPEGGFMWAPDCAYRDGKYYYYFPHPSGSEWNDTWKIGVAISDKPASGFKSAGYLKGLGGFAMIDPAVFVDTDGQAYLYYGGGGHCGGVKLKPSMTEIDGAAQPMAGLVDFHEATWVFKRKGLYYLTYADNSPRHNQMRYATSTNALGPWTYKGIYLGPTDCDTTHGSVVEYKGQWYQFYHNSSLSGQGTLRSVCVDVLHFDADGNILPVVQTRSGPPAVGAETATETEPGVQYPVANATVGNGAVIAEDHAAAGGHCVQNMHLDRSYVEFTGVEGGDNGGRAHVSVHYATSDHGKFQLAVNGRDYSFLNFYPTGGWDSFTGETGLTVPLQPGKTNTIRLTGGHGGANIDYVTVTPLDGPGK
jgi:hypothetical protein